MFFGSGDSSKLTDEEQVTLSHLRRLGETGHLVILEEKTTLVAVRAIATFERFESAIALLESFKNIAMLVGALLLMYAATQGAVVDWVAGLSNDK